MWLAVCAGGDHEGRLRRGISIKRPHDYLHKSVGIGTNVPHDPRKRQNEVKIME